MATLPGSCIYRGHVFHRRVRPVEHRLRYRVFSFCLDLDQLDSLDAGLNLFSVNRWNLFSLFHQDLGEGDKEPLRAYVERKLSEQDIVEKPARIRVLCYPRILGYSFNPLVVYYCEREDQGLFAVLHEVHNTFGERQAYALPVNAELSGKAGAEMQPPELFDQYCDKQLYVSPFTPEQMRYRFRLNQPQDTLSLTIEASDEQGLMLLASMAGQREELSDRTLLRVLFSYRLMTLKVISAIHWEAFQLWVKRVPWFRHKPAPGTTP